jgi:beta-lactamase superfamily II metal-dependent hydrolase
MRRVVFTGFCVVVAAVVGMTAQVRNGTLNIYYVDTEGGQSTLFVGPSGESLLVDTGNAGERDLGRIAETLRTAGVTKIDHMWTTHFHGDHVGALLEIAKQFPVGHFYDHGKPHPNDRIVSAQFLASYEALSNGKRTIVKPGDKVKMSGLDITTVASANQFIRSNLSGGGAQNASCTGVKPKDESSYPDADNGESAGFVLSYGRFRTIDLGDLTWNGELDLMCPTNRLGTVDLYLTSHHGLEKSGSPALVQALRPRVVVMNNGTRKGGTAEVFASLQETVGIEDLWQLHWSYNVGLENAPARFIANVDDPATIATLLTTPAPAPGGPPAARGAGGPGGPGRFGAPGAQATPPGAGAPGAAPGSAPAGPAAAGPAPGGGPAAPGVTGGPGGPGGVPGGAAARGGGGAPGAFGGGRGPGGPGAAAHTPAHLIKVTALQDGTFTVTNTRNGFSKTYRPRP